MVSSNWRLGFSKSEPSKSYQNFCIQAAKYGIYPIGWTPIIGKDKGKEIRSWLRNFYKKNGYDPAYIIIDNNIDSLLRYHRGHVIYSNSYDGLTEEIARIACTVLLAMQRM